MNKQHMINSDSITLLFKSRILFTIPIYFRTLKKWHNKYDHDVKSIKKKKLHITRSTGLNLSLTKK